MSWRRGSAGQRAGSDDGRHSFGSCCPEDVAVACRPPSGVLTHAPADPEPLYRVSDEHYYISLGRRPGAPKWVPGWRGCWGRGGGGGGGESLEPFLDKVADMPVVVPQPQFVDKVFAIPVVLQKQIPMMSTVQLTIQIPQLQSTDKVVFVLRVRVVQVQVPQMLVVEVVVIPQLQLIEKIVAIHVGIPVVLQRQIPMVQAVLKTIEIAQVQLSDKVADVLVVHVVQVPQVQVVNI